MRLLTTAVATIALAASAAQVQAQGNGRGNNDQGGGKPVEAGTQDRGNAGGERGNRGRDDPGPSMAQSMRGPDQRDNGKPANGNSARGNGQGSERAAARAVERAAPGDRGRGNDRGVDVQRDLVLAGRRGSDVVRVTDFGSIRPRGFVEGCPPGLAKKNPPCVPPGQARRNWGGRFDRPDFWGLGGLGAGRYFYDDGYLVRLGGDGRIGGYIPLLGGALRIGNAWPSFYEPVRLPSYYESYYGLGPYQNYRYADDVIYRVDPETAAITAIAALLTGDEFAIGQPMPLGYDVYNVPYAYRDRYVDGPDAYYRYGDGYVYEVDPETRLISAAIELLAS